MFFVSGAAQLSDLPLSLCTQERGVGGQGQGTNGDAESIRFHQTPHPRPLSPVLREEGSSARHGILDAQGDLRRSRCGNARSERQLDLRSHHPTVDTGDVTGRRRTTRSGVASLVDAEIARPFD